MIKILDHDILGQLQITNNKLCSTKWTVGANDLIIWVLFIDVIGSGCEGHFSR